MRQTCIKTPRTAFRTAHRTSAIKHRAPNGALRPSRRRRVLFTSARHKAPSAKRCIKTRNQQCQHHPRPAVIKRRAPNGALRLKTGVGGHGLVGAIKHRAPNGALRRNRGRILTVDHEGGDKAPSAKRCIKTRDQGRECPSQTPPCHKAPSAKRCIKTSRSGH